MDTKTVALTMITKDEERCLARCLKSLQGLVDEMIVVDTGSKDKTVEIAQSFGAKIYNFPWIGDFSAARNFALEKSCCNWNLVLDGDEYVTGYDTLKWKKELENVGMIGSIEIQHLYREEDGEFSKSSIRFPRLIPAGVRFQGKIHEQIADRLPTFKSSLVVEHDGYLFEDKGERNLDLLKEELNQNPNDDYILYQMGHTLRVMHHYNEALPYFRRFYENVPITAGYRANGIVSYLMAITKAKAYDEGFRLIQQEEKNLDRSANFWFSCGIFFMEAILGDTKRYISYLTRIEGCYLYCLEIGESGEGVAGTGSFKALYNLGTWYEVSGAVEKAVNCYEQAAAMDYKLAINRLKKLGIGRGH